MCAKQEEETTWKNETFPVLRKNKKKLGRRELQGMELIVCKQKKDMKERNENKVKEQEIHERYSKMKIDVNSKIVKKTKDQAEYISTRESRPCMRGYF